MSNDDLDRTMIMPSPGRKRGTGPETAASPEPMQPVAAPTSPVSRAGQGQNEDGLSLKMVGSSGSNALVNAATLIFSLAKQLRNTSQHSDIPGLLAHVTGLMKSFEKNSIEKEVSPDVAYEARYILCAFIDEIVLNTPWGSGSVWSYSSLLSALHNDTSGGERFFQMLATKSDAPAQNVVLLELMYHCLCLGTRTNKNWVISQFA
jgi:type VI secretion system protein ImpK